MPSRRLLLSNNRVSKNESETDAVSHPRPSWNAQGDERNLREVAAPLFSCKSRPCAPSFVHDTFARYGVMDIDRTWGQTLHVSLITVIGGMLSAGGSNAINMWYDADIDPHMRRTMNRPIPLGHAPRFALIFGTCCGGRLQPLPREPEAAFWSAFSVMFYVLVYSMRLKRRTPQNIVIGGIAGSTPPLIGWAAAAGDSIANANMFDLGSPVPWMLFFLIFLWTPPHFWALALYRSGVRQDKASPRSGWVKGAEHTVFILKVMCVLLLMLVPFLVFGQNPVFRCFGPLSPAGSRFGMPPRYGAIDPREPFGQRSHAQNAESFFRACSTWGGCSSHSSLSPLSLPNGLASLVRYDAISAHRTSF